MATRSGLERIGALRGAVIRDSTEQHRSSSSLEAFFDLCFVVAVAQVSTGLHQTLAAHHLGTAITSYLSVFFAVWWAWMNFTWFANTHDADDVPYRLLTLIQMSGALVMAVGVPAVFAHADFTTITIGYLIMRLAQITQWLRVARSFRSMRRRALRFAVGYVAVQAIWVGRLFVHHGTATVVYVLAATLEVLVPVWADHRAGTVYHAEHITDRYGLFTLIVLGEAVSAATLGVQDASKSGITPRLITIAAAALICAFAAWWLYFGNPHRHGPDTPSRLFQWGYGHYLVFASLGALGAGVHLCAQYLAQPSPGPAPVDGTEVVSITNRVAALAVAIPVAVFVLTMLLLAVTSGNRRRDKIGSLAVAALVVLVTGLLASVVVGAVIITVTLLALVTVLTLSSANSAERDVEPVIAG